jgi:hypothetical protein
MFNPQNLNRFSYVRNNPIRYTDPSGHAICLDGQQCGTPLSIEATLWAQYKVKLSTGGNAKWATKDKAAALLGVQAVAAKLEAETGVNGAAAFQQVYGSLTFKMVESYEYDGKTYDSGACACGGPNTILFASFYNTGSGYNRSSSTTMDLNRNLIVHELGHQFSYNWKAESSANPVNMFSDGLLIEAGWPANPAGADKMWRQHPSSSEDPISRGEVFADMFLGWVFGKFANDPRGIGAQRMSEMDTIMTVKLDELIH